MAKRSAAFDRWTKKLSECVELELLTWRGRMVFDSIRALAVQCQPWHGQALTISFLTDRELFDQAECGKWSVADWRMYDFTSGPTTHWPCADELMRAAHKVYMKCEDKGRGEEVRDLLVKCCARGLESRAVAQALKQYKLAKDFELFTGHPDDPDRNYCQHRA